jgi:ectoine hydroxylase
MRRRPDVIREADGGPIRSIFGVHRISARFDALTRDSRLLDIAGQLLGSDVYVHQSRLNQKPALCGRGFDWHSDFETWHAEDGMPRMRCFSVSVVLTHNHPSNGPLTLIPGSHRTFYPTVGRTPERYWETSLKRQRVGVPELADLEAAAARGGIVSACGGPGTVILFECNTLHASSDNLSNQPRPNLFFVYNSVENRLREPYSGLHPRPEWLATRADERVMAHLGASSSAVA